MAFEWASQRRWTELSQGARQSTVSGRSGDRRPALTGVVSELVIKLIEEVGREGQLDAVQDLAREISESIGDEFERRLSDGGPDRRSNRHLWCVVLAAICRLFDEAGDFTKRSIDELVDEVVRLLEEEVSQGRSDSVQARDIYQYRKRVVAAFGVDQYPWLRILIKKALKGVVSALQSIGEEAVMKYVRLIGAIACPDPDRHPAVVKHCIWPLLDGPFRELLEEAVASEMRVWLRNAYIALPSPAAAAPGLGLVKTLS
jgi:hypothetical protein